jgi:hypothetical protein
MQKRRFAGNDSDQNERHPLSADLVIPRIAIINASNFESNASSVHLYDDCIHKQVATIDTGQTSDQYLDTLYANTRTRSLSEADSSQDKSATALALEEDEPEEIKGSEQLTDDSTGLESTSCTLDHEKQLRDVDLLSQVDKIGKVKVADPVIVTVDARQEMTSTASKDTTRSNSIQSQEANVSLKLKAYNKVTERCKRNIVDKKGRCEKCCVLS